MMHGTMSLNKNARIISLERSQHLPRNLLHVMRYTNKQCGFSEMFDTTADVTGLLEAVTEVNEKLQSFDPNSAKRHKGY